jgi:hypothetical protein
MRFLGAVVVGLGCVSNSAGAQGDSSAAHPIDLAAAKAAFDELQALSDRDGGDLWGVELAGPTLFVDPSSRFVVANRADAEGQLQEEDGAFFGVLPPAVNVANTTTRWAGVQWTMIMWPLPEDPPQRGILMMHESFHRVQHDLGFKLAMPANSHLDEASGRTWLRLEWRALAAALSESDPLASDAVRDALSFRAHRLALNAGAEEEENDLMLNEGLAEYTGVRLSGYSHEDQVKRTINLLRAYDQASTVSRSFAYPTGPAYGLLLDRAEPQWRARIVEAGDLAGALEKAINFAPAALSDDEIMARAAAYDAESIMVEEIARQEAREARIAELRNMFITGPVLIIPMDGETSFSFDPGGAEALPGQGTVYSSMRITGGWGVLESSGPVLWINQGTAQPQFRVPAPVVSAEGGVSGESWMLTLEPGWRAKPQSNRGDYIIERE